MPHINKQTEHEQTVTMIKQYIAETILYDKPEVTLTNDLLLIEQNIIDSLQIFQLIAFLQEQFGFTVEPEEMMLENFESINAIAHLVTAHRSNLSENKC